MAGAKPSPSSAAAAAAVPSATSCINDVLASHDLLEEVLIRVPLSDLFRCTSVCKLWLSCIRDNPYFKKRFIQQQRMMINADDDQQQLTTCLPCGTRQMLLASSSTPILKVNGLDLSLDFLPSFGDSLYYHVVAGSSNGLLLCGIYGTWSSASFQKWPEAYYVCNPLTKQWLALPPPPDDLVRPPFYSDSVGFICDPFYHVKDDDEEGNSSAVTLNDGFGFTVVCCRYYSPEGVVGTIDVTVFSSKTGCWTGRHLTVGKGLRFKPTNYPKNAVSDDSRRRLYWLLNPCHRVLIFDASEDVWLMAELATTPLDAFRLDDHPAEELVPFDGFSRCQGSWWAGQVRAGRRLRIFNNAVIGKGDEWCLKHDVDILDGMDCSSSSVKDAVTSCGGRVVFHGMHPSDPMVGYLSVGDTFLECNFEGRTLKLAGDDDDSSDENVKRPIWKEWSALLPFSLPLWPTPLPAIYVPAIEAITNVDDD